MKKSLLFLFLLVLGVTQGWAVDYLTLPAGGGELVGGAIYRVESNTTINSTLSVPTGATVTIYIAKGKILTVKGTNGTIATGNTAKSVAAKPAIEVPSITKNNETTNSTLIITGAGTLRAYGGKAGRYYSTTGDYGGGGAAPAIGGSGGAAGDQRGGYAGDPMGIVYVRGNVTVRVARGTSLGRRATSGHGADGCVPTYAIGGGGGSGAGQNSSRNNNGATGDNGKLYVEKTARVIYLNGKRRIGTAMTAIPTTNANKVTVTYTDYDSRTESDVALTPSATDQTITEYGFININNDKYYSRISIPVTSPNPATGFEQVTITTKKVKNWTTKPNGEGTVYNPKDLVLADGTGEGVAQNKTLKLYANWEENSAVTFNVIHNAEELMKFARMVNGMGEYENNAIEDANGILMADIDMSNDAWTKEVNDGKTWGDWKPWVPIGKSMREKFAVAANNASAAEKEENADAPENTKPFSGIFDGNGYIVSNITMDQTLTGHDAYSRAGLFGYAKSATIKNVVVMNATLRAKWQMAAVCGRLDGGTIENCGSYGTFNYSFENVDLLPGSKNARAAAGVVVTDGVSNANAPSSTVNSVWSTYDQYANPGNNNVKYNQVVGDWNNNYNDDYNNYTQNAGTGTTKKTWVYVSSANSSWLANGKLCLDLNDNVDGATTWTQTFVNADDNDPCSYNECPRPTNRGLAVYSGEPNYNLIYTISFESNGGSGCADEYIIRQSDKSMNYPELPTPTRGGNEFLGWYNSNSDNATEVTSTNGITSDITLYAKWNMTMTVKVNQDKDNNIDDAKKYYYCTFYYSDQAYKILTPGALAYKAKRKGEVASLTMEIVKDVNGKVSKIIPAGEAVILRVKVPEGDKENKVISLQAVDSDDDIDIDPDNILYGSDEVVPVEEISDDIPDTSTGAAEDATRTNCYVFSSNVDHGIGFYKPNASTLKAHMAFALLDGQININATVSNDSQAKTLSMIFEGDEEQVTGISEHKSESETKKSIFSINGMPLSKLQKGINIVGGKKVFVK